MQIRDAGIWATILDANPLPAGLTPDPRTWVAWYRTASFEARGQLYGAVVVLVAERWADGLEIVLEEYPLPWTMSDSSGAGLVPLAVMAMATLNRIKFEFGPFAPDVFQIGCALTMLEQTWVHGAVLREALEVQLLEALVVTGSPS